MEEAKVEQKVNIKTGIFFDWWYAYKSDYEKALKFSHKNREVLLDALNNPELDAYLTQFCKRYYDSLLVNLQLGKSHLSRLSEQDRLFFDVVASQFGLNDVVTLAFILAKKEEAAYQAYSKYVGTAHYTWKDVVKRSLEYTIQNRGTASATINTNHVIRKLQELDIRLIASKSFLERKLTDYAESLYESWRLEVYGKLLIKGEWSEDIDGVIDQKILEETFRNHYDFSLDRNDYIKGEEDFKKDNKIDRAYKERCGQLLIDHFRGCAKCGTKMGENCFEYNHFWLPKSKGGNFVMRSPKGYYVNNCIPLCRTCHTTKGEQSANTFFKEAEERKRIFSMSQSLEPEINKMLRTYEDEDFSCRINY